MKVVETVTPIGVAVLREELLEVSGRTGDLEGLWVRRLWPTPNREYGVVRFPLSPRPLHSASMWTWDWLAEDRAELADRVVAVYRGWITEGCPVRQPFPVLSGMAVAQ